MNLALLVPVKDLTRAKTRLAGLLTEPERQALALCMLRGVLAEAESLGKDLRRVMVTNYEPAKLLAREHGFELLEETEQISESHSVDMASRNLENMGVTGVFRVPLDLPIIRREELEGVIALAREEHAAVLVPSIAMTGTNGLYRSPPTLFASQFGPNSLALHTQAAHQNGVEPTVLQQPGMALDIDDPGDIELLMGQGIACPTVEYLRKIGIEERLAESRLAEDAKTGS